MDIAIQHPWFRRALGSLYPTRLFDQFFGEGLFDYDFFPYVNPTISPYYRQSLFRNFLESTTSGISEVRSDRDKFAVYLDVKHFSPDELCVKVVDDYVEIQGKHGERQRASPWRRCDRWEAFDGEVGPASGMCHGLVAGADGCSCGEMAGRAGGGGSTRARLGPHGRVTRWGAPDRVIPFSLGSVDQAPLATEQRGTGWFRVLKLSKKRGQDDHGYISREFHRRYRLPNSVDQSAITCTLSPDGMLTLCGPKVSMGTDPNRSDRNIPVTREDKPNSAPPSS
ncbi:hypothetical protein JZ751_006158 [Albula glossodonta]|uniref:Alpha-crystallin A chain n=1 Tax=Albula glossodonta TaxID=121402 RepID=A0A8T2NEX5_9TELE|nr:hypothetical protein JZ751_006158 [Albula glossodonta]